MQDPLEANERGKLVQAQAVPVVLHIVVRVVRAQVAVQAQVLIHQDQGQRIKRVCFSTNETIKIYRCSQKKTERPWDILVYYSPKVNPCRSLPTL